MTFIKPKVKAYIAMYKTYRKLGYKLLRNNAFTFSNSVSHLRADEQRFSMATANLLDSINSFQRFRKDVFVSHF